MPGEPVTAAQALFEQLRTDGEACLQRWRDERHEEGVSLECKRAAAQQPGMSKSDIEQLAKTASAFANSEGGVLIFGVDAREQDGRDAIQSLVPIPDIAEFERSAERVRADLLSPAHSDIEIMAIPSRTNPTSGYLAIRVDQSDRRPHRSLKDQVYYRRSRDRTYPMEHSDLRDAMARAAGPDLKMSIDLADIRAEDYGSIATSNSFTVLVAIGIENVGGAMARFPFLHLDLTPGGGLYDPVSNHKMQPAWPRLITEGREERLQGGVDAVIPVGTKVRVAYAFWTYKRDTTTIGGQPLSNALLGLRGRFGCDGFRTHAFVEAITAPQLIVEMDRRKIPLRPADTWPEL